MPSNGGRRQKTYRQQRRRVTAQREVFKMLGNVCKFCNHSDPAALCLDHVDGGGAYSRAYLGHEKGAKLCTQIISGRVDLNLFQLLCFNCNEKKTIYGPDPALWPKKRFLRFGI